MNNNIKMILGSAYYSNNTSQNSNVSQNNTEDFTKVLKNTFTKKSSIRESKTTSENDNTVKKDTISSNEGSNDKSMKTTNGEKKIKDVLKKSGVPEEKIKEIKVDDLDKITGVLSSENVDISNLNYKDLILLLQFLINSNENLDGEKILEQAGKVVENSIRDTFIDTTNKKVDSNELVNIIKDKLNGVFDEISSKLNDEQKIPLVKELVNSLQDKLTNIVEEEVPKNIKLPKEDMIKEIKKEILKLVKVEDKDSKVTISKEEQHVIKVDNTEKSVISQKQNSNKEENKEPKDNKTSAEEKILKSISGDDKKDKFSKAVNFINHFNSLSKPQGVEVMPVEELVVNKDTIVSDVIKAVKYMDVNNSKNLTVKINPKELGEIVINITMESGKMKANITANNKEAFNLLNANISDINDKLQNSNIKIQNFSLNLYEDTTFFKDKEGRGQESRNNKGNESKNTTINEVEEVSENNVSDDIANLNIFA